MIKGLNPWYVVRMDWVINTCFQGARREICSYLNRNKVSSMHWHEHRVLSQLSDLQFNKHHLATPGVTSQGPTGSHHSSLCLDKHSSFVGALPWDVPAMIFCKGPWVNGKASLLLEEGPAPLSTPTLLEFSAMIGSRGALFKGRVNVRSTLPFPDPNLRCVDRLRPLTGAVLGFFRVRSINKAPEKKELVFFETATCYTVDQIFLIKVSYNGWNLCHMHLQMVY